MAKTKKERNAILDTCPEIFDIYEEKPDSELYEALEKHVKENLAADLTGSVEQESDQGTEKDFTEGDGQSGSAATDDLDLDGITEDFENMMTKE